VFGVLGDAENSGGGYIKNSVSSTVFVMYASGHAMGYVQMKERNTFCTLCNTMMAYEITGSGGMIKFKLN
jgi:hypothetical protein